MKKWYWLLAVIGILVVINVISPSYDAHEQTRGHFSSTTYSNRETGMKGLYLLLQKFRPNEVHRWKMPLCVLNEKASEKGVIIIPDPISQISQRDAEALDVWMEQGGMVILMKKGEWFLKNSKINTFLDERGISEEIEKMTKVPSPNGTGELVVVPQFDGYQNKGLIENPEQNIELIQEILSHSGSIYFDEYHLNIIDEGDMLTMLSRFLKTSWGWCCLQATLAILLYVMLYRLRIDRGDRRPQVTEEEERLSQTRIKALSHFFRGAKAKALCQQIINTYYSEEHQS